MLMRRTKTMHKVMLTLVLNKHCSWSKKVATRSNVRKKMATCVARIELFETFERASLVNFERVRNPKATWLALLGSPQNEQRK